MWLWRCKFIRWGKETWKRGDEWRGGGGIVREAEAERVRACACARLSEHLVSVPAATLSARKDPLRACYPRWKWRPGAG